MMALGRRAVIVGLILAVCGACINTGVVLSEVRLARTEFGLIFDTVDGVMVFENCDDTNRSLSLQIELWERFGTAPVDSMEFEVTIFARETGVEVPFDGLTPRQTGQHLVRIRWNGNTTSSGVFDVL